MSAWLPEIEGWMKVLGVTVGVVMAVLVPVRSWIVEDRRYRAQMLDAAASAGRTVTAAVSAAPAPAGSGLLGSTVALEGLIAAVRDCAAAIRETDASGQARESDRLARAIDRLLDRA